MPEPAELFRDGQAEHAELAHLLHDRDRDQLVLEVPSVRVGHDHFVAELAELVADHLERLVEARCIRRKCSRATWTRCCWPP